MYAGRYLWWNTMATVAYVFLSFYLYYVVWLAIRLSGCAAVVGGCGAIESRFNGVLRPYGIIACGIVVVVTSVMRVRFLRMNILWALALFIWFGASSDFFFNLGNLYYAHVDLATILRMMPLETLFLVAMVAFLCFPIELYKVSPEGGLKVITYVAGFTASYAFTFTVANSPMLPAYVKLATHSEKWAALVLDVQNRLGDLVSLGHPGTLPVVMAFALFLGSLSYLIVMRKMPGGVAGHAAA